MGQRQRGNSRGWRKLHNEKFYGDCIPHGILLEISKQGG
jgi:hypothetical protein